MLTLTSEEGLRFPDRGPARAHRRVQLARPFLQIAKQIFVRAFRYDISVGIVGLIVQRDARIRVEDSDDL